MSRRPEGGLWRRDTRPGALVLAGTFALAAFAALAFAVIISPAFIALDEAASEWFASLDLPILGPIFTAVTHVGDFWPMVALTTIAFAVLMVRGRRSEAVLVAGTVAAGTAIGYLLKEVIERVRPSLELARITLPDSYSFPSGHALASLLFFGSVAVVILFESRTLATRAWTLAICITMPVLIGLSRVYLGVHWFGDIVASWILGVAILMIANALYIIATSGRPRPG